MGCCQSKHYDQTPLGNNGQGGTSPLEWRWRTSPCRHHWWHQHWHQQQESLMRQHRPSLGVIPFSLRAQEKKKFWRDLHYYSVKFKESKSVIFDLQRGSFLCTKDSASICMRWFRYWKDIGKNEPQSYSFSWCLSLCSAKMLLLSAKCWTHNRNINRTTDGSVTMNAGGYSIQERQKLWGETRPFSMNHIAKPVIIHEHT